MFLFLKILHYWRRRHNYLTPLYYFSPVASEHLWKIWEASFQVQAEPLQLNPIARNAIKSMHKIVPTKLELILQNWIITYMWYKQ